MGSAELRLESPRTSGRPHGLLRGPGDWSPSSRPSPAPGADVAPTCGLHGAGGARREHRHPPRVWDASALPFSSSSRGRTSAGAPSAPQFAAGKPKRLSARRRCEVLAKPQHLAAGGTLGGSHGSRSRGRTQQPCRHSFTENMEAQGGEAPLPQTLVPGRHARFPGSTGDGCACVRPRGRGWRSAVSCCSSRIAWSSSLCALFSFRRRTLVLSRAALCLSPRRIASGDRAILWSIPLVFAFLFGESEAHLSQSSGTARQVPEPGSSLGSVLHEMGQRCCLWHFSGNHHEVPGSVHIGRTEHKLLFASFSLRCHLQSEPLGAVCCPDSCSVPAMPGPQGRLPHAHWHACTLPPSDGRQMKPLETRI